MKELHKNICLTDHAKIKMNERSISLSMVEKTINNPDSTTADKFDNSVIHFIKKVGTKYLRVLARSDNNNKIIITAFFDRRIKKELRND